MSASVRCQRRSAFGSLKSSVPVVDDLGPGSTPHRRTTIRSVRADADVANSALGSPPGNLAAGRQELVRITSRWVARVIATAVARPFDALAERLRVDEDDQIELEPLAQLRDQRPDAGPRTERANVSGTRADDAGDPVGMRGEPGVEDRAQIRPGPVYDGDAVAPDGHPHVGVPENGPDDRLGFRHDLCRRPGI
jgi:hypothetical protein